MKLLIVGNGSIGIHKDSQFYINNHTGHFLKHVSKLHSVTFTQSATKFEQDNNLQNFELKENKIDFCTLPRIKQLTFIPSVFKLLKNNELVYLFYPGTVSKLIALFSILLKKRFGLYIRGQYYNQNFLDRIILNKAAFILTVSPAFGKDLHQFCSRTKIIKPMISIKQTDLYRGRTFIQDQKKNLLFVGRVEERKGIYELIEIAETLKEKHNDFVLNIVGGGDLFNSIKKEVSKKGLMSHIIIHGLISDKNRLKELYNNADIFVFTSHDEGFPRVLYEAMASALPIFTTFVGGIPGRMEHLKNCIEIPVRNALAAGDIIGTYLTKEKVLEEIGRNGQQTLEKIIDGSLLSHEDLLLKQVEDEK